MEWINPILRGWVNYFRIGHASRCFSHIRDWVEKKIRRHLMRQRGRRGYGWKRWSRRWLYEGLGLYSQYRVERLPEAVGELLLPRAKASAPLLDPTFREGCWKRGLRRNCAPTPQPKGRGWKPSA